MIKRVHWRLAFLNLSTVILIIVAVAWLLLFLIDFTSGVVASLYNPLVAAALATISAVLISIHGRIKDREYEKSRFYLEKTIEGYDKADSILNEGGNERTAWIGAARVLEKSRRLSEKIKVDEHKDVFEVEMDYQRRRFSQFFNYAATYYYGAPGSAQLDLDEAARYSNTREKGEYVSKTIKQIPESAIYTIYKIMAYPDNYVDPLEGKFTEREIKFLGYSGLKDYLKHIRKRSV